MSRAFGSRVTRQEFSMRPTGLSGEIIEALIERLRLNGVLSTVSQLDEYAVLNGARFTGRPEAVLLPGSTKEVAAAVSICRNAHVPLVTKTALERRRAKPNVTGRVILDLSAMDRVRAFDPIERLIEVEAGALVAVALGVAEDVGLWLPGRRGVEDTHTIGSLIAWNASPGRGPRYGTVRDLVLGVEAVLPNGTVVDCQRNFRGDVGGFDWKQLVVGSEDTLAIVTAAVLRLEHAPRTMQYAVATALDVESITRMYWHARNELGSALLNVEIYSRNYVDALEEAGKFTIRTEDNSSPWLVVVEAEANFAEFKEVFRNFIGASLKERTLNIAQSPDSIGEIVEIIELREHMNLVETNSSEQILMRHHVCLPLRRWQEFIDSADAAVRELSPSAEPHVFASLDESLIQYNVFVEPDHDSESIKMTIYELATSLEGDFVDVAKLKSAKHLDLLKTALDPQNLLNCHL